MQCGESRAKLKAEFFNESREFLNRVWSIDPVRFHEQFQPRALRGDFGEFIRELFLWGMRK